MNWLQAQMFQFNFTKSNALLISNCIEICPNHIFGCKHKILIKYFNHKTNLPIEGKEFISVLIL